MPTDSLPLTPAQQYAAAAERASYPRMTAFAATRPFELDPFQEDACRALEDGATVLVCAPTGAGKTVVGEFAVARARAMGGKCFYTTPIKALSNQKFHDLAAEHGADAVGLLTGDTSINSHADIVVMTTEVLRNMLYAESSDLVGLSAVVLDEVHFLADRFRGAVWEEVILHLPAEVQIVGLSATVSNAEEFGDWLREVRGETAVIVDEVRPVPLWQHMMVGRRLYNLYAEVDEGRRGAARDGARVPSDRRRRVEPELQRAINAASRQHGSHGRDDSSSRASRSSNRRHDRYERGHERWRPTPRPAVVERLDRAGLLPAIVFIFSRAGCDAAVAQCARGGVRLTDESERAAIRTVVERSTAELPPDDLEVVGYWQWREALEAGIASHHAGLLPVMKETVEQLFVRGLVKVVFATDTLALGINMPARSVVLERLVKYNGETHAAITPGEYTQLTGRAGRRGIDVEGHAVVLWSPEVDPGSVAGLAAARTFPLYSSFTPTYNMVVNIVDQLGRRAARSLLEQSLAQFQVDRAVVGKVREVARKKQNLAELSEQLQCGCGDIGEYLNLQERLASSERANARKRSARRRETTAEDLAAIRRGDVIYVPAGRRAGLAVVLDARPDSDGTVRPLVATIERWAGRLHSSDFFGAVPVLGHLKLARHVEHRNLQVRRDLSSSLRATGIASPPRNGAHGRSAAEVDAAADGSDSAALEDAAGDAAGDADDAETDSAPLRRAVRSHPVHTCRRRDQHLRTGRDNQRLAARIAALETQVAEARHSLATALDRIGELLTHRGYLDGEAATDAGRTLQRIWSESDLLVTECLRRGLWKDLPAAELAGVVSSVIFESRGDMPGRRRALTGRLDEGMRAVEEVWVELTADERRHRVAQTREPDPGLGAAIATWVRGGSLGESLTSAAAGGVELSAGDFVRWCRQVVDLLDQVRHAVPSELAPQAGRAVASIRRGVVAMGTS